MFRISEEDLPHQVPLIEIRGKNKLLFIVYSNSQVHPGKNWGPFAASSQNCSS